MTYQPRSEFLRVMIDRGYVADCTDHEGLDRALLAGPVSTMGRGMSALSGCNRTPSK